MGCGCGIIAWSHRSRFRVGLKLVGTSAKRLLDYGSGDGTFLAMASDRIGEGVGAEIAADQIEDSNKRLAAFANLSFCDIGQLDGSHDRSYDVVTCMETLEHCTAPIVEVVLKNLARMVAPGGRVVISVPIEIGPMFPVKKILRKVASWRSLPEYRFYESYSLRNSLRMIFAGRNTVLERPIYGEPGSHSHYGFNWLALRERIRTHLTIERTTFSPLASLRGLASSQAWMICRPLDPASVG